MLFTETVSEKLLEVLYILQDEKLLKDFRLVGGTALSLQTGHRISADIDLFTDQKVHLDPIILRIGHIFPNKVFEKIEESNTIRPGFRFSIDDIKVDIYKWHPGFVLPFLTIDNLRLADCREIAAMKLNAIIYRKEKKDYADLVELLQIYSFEDLLKVFNKKYPGYEVKILIEHLLKFNLADHQPDPRFLKSQTWEGIKIKISDTLSNYFIDLSGKLL